MGLKLFAQNPLQYQINQQGGGNCAGSPVELSVATVVRLNTTAASGITASSAISGGIVTNDGGNAVTQLGICYSTNPNPATANSTTSNGSGLGAFTSNLEGLLPNTTYYVRAYAINSAGTFYGNEVSFTTSNIANPTAHSCGVENVHNPAKTYGSITDQDGNVYKTIVIGNQEWMAENLKSSHYLNGDLIPVITNAQIWSGLNYGATCWYENDSAKYSCPYGKLYNWFAAADPRNLCPAGWHVPSETELKTLINYIDPSANGADCGINNNTVGGKMKSTGNQLWQSPNASADNSSGFSSIPGGWQFAVGGYQFIGWRGHYWSSTAISTSSAYDISQTYLVTSVLSCNSSKQSGYSVRCLKNTDVLQGTINSIDCSSATNFGIIAPGTIVSGVSSSVPYTGGNGGSYSGQIVSSSGVTGLTASITAGTFANGNGLLFYTITGSPSGAGIASFTLNIGGQSCTLARTVSLIQGSISVLNCNSSNINGTLTSGIAATGITSIVNYTGGNAGTYSSSTVTSSGVLGLTANLTPGTFANGAGSLTYTISGIPSTSGIAIFAISIGGQTCNLQIPVNAALTGSLHSCGAENVHNPTKTYGSMTDQDGNVYKTIVIGTQQWMAENLKVSHYRNGELIPNITDNAQWAGSSTGACCYYNNNSSLECPFGKLYNWYAVTDSRNLCPSGWHVPSEAEWSTLTNFLGGQDVAGGKMKSIGSQYWLSPNAGATNESGFSGLPIGNRTAGYGSFPTIGYDSYWWSSTNSFTNFARYRYLNYNNNDVYGNDFYKRSGLSVRCIKN